MFSVVALAAVVAAPALPALNGYQVHATMIQDGKVLWDQGLTAKAGETKAIVNLGDVGTYALKVIATPDVTQKAGTDGISLSLDLVVSRKASDRRVATTVVVKAGEPVTLTLPADGADPAIQMNVSADKI